MVSTQAALRNYLSTQMVELFLRYIVQVFHLKVGSSVPIFPVFTSTPMRVLRSNFTVKSFNVSDRFFFCFLVSYRTL